MSVDRGSLEDSFLTVAEVAELSESTLASLLGAAMGRQLYALSRNLDRRRVTGGVHRRSVGAQRALGRGGVARLCLDRGELRRADQVQRGDP